MRPTSVSMNSCSRSSQQSALVNTAEDLNSCEEGQDRTVGRRAGGGRGCIHGRNVETLNENQ